MFRWPRALLHALIPFALAIGGGAVLWLIANPVDDERFGEGVGRFAVCALLAGIGISYLVQTRRRRAAVGVIVVLVIAVGALAGAIATAPRHSAAKLTLADHAPLLEVVDAGEHRLRHPTLGFSILRPPPGYVSSPKLAQAFNARDDLDMATYMFAEDPPAAIVGVNVLNGTDTSRAGVRVTLDGIKHGLAASAPGGKVDFLTDEITGDDEHLVIHLHAVAQGVHIQLVGYLLHPAGRGPTLATLTTFTADVSQLADVLQSFRP